MATAMHEDSATRHRDLVTIFRAIDVDHDGDITGNELAAFFKSKHKLVPTLRKALKEARPSQKGGSLFNALDKDGSHTISEAEFFSALYVPHWQLTKMFRLIDHDGDGEIDKAELYGFLKETSTYSTPEDREHLRALLKVARPVKKKQGLFQALDADGSGTVSKDEFFRALLVEHWDLVQIFRTIDTDRSGTIEAAELHAFLRSKEQKRLKDRLIFMLKTARPQKKGEHKSLFQCLDSASPDGHITIDDFVKALYVKNYHLVDIFRHIDQDGDDVITAEELKAFLKDKKNPYGAIFRKVLQVSRPQKKHQKLFKVLDKDGDGYITKKEFCAALAVNPPPSFEVVMDPVKPVAPVLAAKPVAAAPARPVPAPVQNEGACECIIA